MFSVFDVVRTVSAFGPGLWLLRPRYFVFKLTQKKEESIRKICVYTVLLEDIKVRYLE